MLKTIFAITIIGIASSAGAVQLTIAEKLEDIRVSKELIRQAIESQGVQVSSSVPLSQYGAKIRQIAATRFIGSSVDFCLGTITPSTTLSINSIFSSICSPLSATTKFPYANCGGRTHNAVNYTWEGTSCPLVSTTASIYGNARCSTQYDRNHGSDDNLYDAFNSATGLCFRATNGPSNNPGTGRYCWCQLCTDSARTSCGGWVFRKDNGVAGACAADCPRNCGDNAVYGVDTHGIGSRIALCAAPAP